MQWEPCARPVGFQVGSGSGGEGGRRWTEAAALGERTAAARADLPTWLAHTAIGAAEPRAAHVVGTRMVTPP